MKPDEIPAGVVQAALRADHEAGTSDGRSYHEVAEHQVRRLIAGAVAAERERIRQAVLGCLSCGQVHTCRQVPGPPGKLPGWTWSDPDDGHTYRPAFLAHEGPREALSAALSLPDLERAEGEPGNG